MKLLLYATVLLMSFFSSGQLTADSIREIITKFDTNRYPRALQFCESQLEKAREEDDYATMADLYIKRLTIYVNMGDSVHAMEEMKTGLKLCKEHQLGFEHAALRYQYVRILTERDRISEAMQYLVQNNYYLRKNYPDSNLLGNNLMVTAYYYNLLGDYGEAEKLLLEALPIKSREDPGNIPAIYNNLGVLAKHQKDFDRSLSYYFEALSACKKSATVSQYSPIYNNIGATYLQMNQPDSAIIYLQEGRKYINPKDFQFIQVYSNLAIAYLDLNQLDSSEYYTQLTLDYLDTGNPPLQLKVDIFSTAVELYKQLGNPSKALHYAELLQEASKNLWYFEDREKLISEVELKAEVQYQKDIISELEQKNYYQELSLKQRSLIVLVTIIALVLVVLVGALIFYQRTLQQRQIRAELEQQALINQLNPHFIFNALTAIQSYVVQNKPEEAVTYMQTFSDLMRGILQQTRAKRVTVEEEINTLRKYLDLQLLRMKDLFDYHFQIDDDLIKEKAVIPSLMIQPLVENAIEHGIRTLKAHKGVILLSFKKEKSALHFTLEDNGVGRKEASLSSFRRKNAKGHALDILKERLSNLFDRRRYLFRITDLENMEQENKGTRVELVIPLM